MVDQEDLSGPERRKGYKELAEQMEIHSHQIEDRLRRFFTKALAAFAVIGLASAIALLGFGYVLKQQDEQSADIQEQRFQSLVTGCREQNLRHERTLLKTKQLPNEAQATVIALLDELVPYREDCISYARERVKGN